MFKTEKARTYLLKALFLRFLTSPLTTQLNCLLSADFLPTTFAFPPANIWRITFLFVVFSSRDLTFSPILNAFIIRQEKAQLTWITLDHS